MEIEEFCFYLSIGADSLLCTSKKDTSLLRRVGGQQVSVNHLFAVDEVIGFGDEVHQRGEAT
jgi:hypothetical protein